MSASRVGTPARGVARWFELAARTAVPVLAVGLVAAAVVGVPRLVGASPERAGRQATLRQGVPLQVALLSCPGALAAGSALDSAGSSTGQTTEQATEQATEQVLAAGLPQALLPAPWRSPPGSVPAAVSMLALEDATGATAPPSRQLTGLSVVRGSVGGGGAVVALGRGVSAPGLVAEQWDLATSGDQRGLSGATCLPPQDDIWLVGGGDEEGRRGRLVLSNPHDSATQVSLEVLAADGPAPRSPGSSLLLAPRSRTEVLLEAVAPGVGSPTVRVRSSGASVGAVLHDSWLDGIVPRGADDVVSAAPPSRRALVPGVLVPAASTGRITLRVAVPGTAEGVAQVRLFGPKGEVQLPGTDVVRVPAGSTQDVDLSAAPAGAYGVSVQSDVPVVAAVRVEQRRDDGPSEFAWAASSAPVSTLAGAAVPDGAVGGAAVSGAAVSGASAKDLGEGWRTSVLLTGVPASRGNQSDPVVDVVSVLAGGEQRSRTVRVPTGSTVRVPVEGRSVWVRPQPGHAAVVAARWTQREDKAGPLITVSAMRQVVLRQVPMDVVPAVD